MAALSALDQPIVTECFVSILFIKITKCSNQAITVSFPLESKSKFGSFLRSQAKMAL